MPESKDKNGWKLYSIRKLIEYGALATSLWAFGVPAINEHIEKRIDAYEKEHKSSKSFRQLLSEETGIRKDRIHIVFGNWYSDHIESERTISAIYPLLQEELSTIQPRLIIFEGGRAKWLAEDGELYDTSKGEDGYRYYWQHNQWNICKF